MQMAVEKIQNLEKNTKSFSLLTENYKKAFNRIREIIGVENDSLIETYIRNIVNENQNAHQFVRQILNLLEE